MTDLWLSILAFFGDREARKTLNRRRGARKAAVTRRTRRGMDASVVLSASMAAPDPQAQQGTNVATDNRPITERTTVTATVLDDRDA